MKKKTDKMISEMYVEHKQMYARHKWWSEARRWIERAIAATFVFGVPPIWYSYILPHMGLFCPIAATILSTATAIALVGALVVRADDPGTMPIYAFLVLSFAVLGVGAGIQTICAQDVSRAVTAGGDLPAFVCNGTPPANISVPSDGNYIEVDCRDPRTGIIVEYRYYRQP